MESGFKILKIIVLFVTIVLLITILAAWHNAWAQSYSSTGNPDDTPTGQDVTALATQETINYKDFLLQTMPSTSCASGDETHTTTSEYGFSVEVPTGVISVTPGDEEWHHFFVTMEGNANDSVDWWAWYEYGGGADNWQVEMYVGPIVYSYQQTLIPGESTLETEAVDDDSHIWFHYKVIVSSEAAHAPNGSYITIITTIETSSEPVGQYTGGNALTYGGTSEATDRVTDEVSAPILVLTRISTIDAPIAYTGGRHDAVPGAVITFTMTISNDGTASAESVVLVDGIPNYADGYTRLAHVNASGECTNVTIEAAQGTFNGWTVFYTTEASPAKTYEASGWTLIGTTESGAAGEFPGDGVTYLSTSAEASARWIKWEKLYVDPDDDGETLTWGVTIR